MTGTSGSGDWAVQAADTIESVVGTLRDKTTVPLQTAAKAIVYGIVAAVAGTAALILLVAMAVRFLDAYLPSRRIGDHHIWFAYLVVGSASTIGGLFLWRKRTPRT